MQNTRFIELFEQCYKGEASADEKNEFFFLLDAGDHDDQLKKLIDIHIGLFEPHTSPFSMETEQRILLTILNKDVESKSTHKKPALIHKLWLRIAVAAATVILAGVSVYLFQAKVRYNTNLAAVSSTPILPGKQSATLTLANGKKIILSNAANSRVANEAGIVIRKTANGSLIYETQDGRAADENKTNTLSTANGETYQIRLPDGSVVTLNAASSLTYSPSLTRKGIRQVALKGEGYFEVAKDSRHPFIVTTTKAEIRVLGTHFNVSAYAGEESDKTTLLEGSVRIRTGAEQKMLKPGQQADVRADRLLVSAADMESAVAWKNGEFVFTGKTINEIMRMLSRWYNVEVEFKGPSTKEQFEGSMERTNNISEVLKLLELTEGVHFKIEGRKIIVSK